MMPSLFDKCKVFPLDGANKTHFNNSHFKNKPFLTWQGAHIPHFLSSPVSEHRMAVKEEQNNSAILKNTTARKHLPAN